MIYLFVFILLPDRLKRSFSLAIFLMLLIFNPFWFKHLSLKKEAYHYLRFEKDCRYYELRLTKDLLEDWTLIVSNGRIKSKLGKIHTQVFSSFHEALTQFYSTAKLRHHRHYQVTRYLVEDLIYTFLLMHFTAQQNPKQNDETKRKRSTTKTSDSKRMNHKISGSQQICFSF